MLNTPKHTNSKTLQIGCYWKLKYSTPNSSQRIVDKTWRKNRYTPLKSHVFARAALGYDLSKSVASLNNGSNGIMTQRSWQRRFTVQLCKFSRLVIVFQVNLSRKLGQIGPSLTTWKLANGLRNMSVTGTIFWGPPDCPRAKSRQI